MLNALKYLSRLYFQIFIALSFLSVALKVSFWQWVYPDDISLFDPKFISAIVWGLKFDAAIAGLFSFISVILLSINSKSYWFKFSVFSLCWICVSLMIISDFVYFTDAGRHLSYEVKDFFSDSDALFMQALYKYWWQIIQLLTITLLVGTIYFNYSQKLLRTSCQANIPARCLAIFSALLVSILLLRGGLSGVPMTPLTVYAIADAKQADIASNGAYNISYALLKKEKGKVDRRTILTPSTPFAADSLFNTGITSSSDFNGKNVVVILLESWPSLRMEDPRVTPHYNKILSQSVRPLQGYAGGLRTSEGMFSIFCSWQNPLGATVAQSRLQNNRFNCLPQRLKNKGYQSLFLQGSNKDTSGVGSFAQKLGFERSIGKDSIKKYSVPKNSWGAQDVDIYSKALSEIKEMKSPFLLGINTNTTHDSILPEQAAKPFKDLRLNVLHYADFALGEFMTQFEKNLPEQFNNTLFILAADHTANLPAGTNILQRFAIPMAIYAKDLSPKLIPRIASHRDLAPTILDYLGLTIPANFSGKSLFKQSSDQGYAIVFASGSLAWIKNEEMIKVDISSGAQQCYKVEKLNTLAQPCNKAWEATAAKLSTFTRISQELLFADELLDVEGQNTAPKQFRQRMNRETQTN